MREGEGEGEGEGKGKGKKRVERKEKEKEKEREEQGRNSQPYQPMICGTYLDFVLSHTSPLIPQKRKRKIHEETMGEFHPMNASLYTFVRES